MRNSSQNAGCIRRLPSSHPCQPRSVQWMSAAAAVCESPAASRAARTCSGDGLDEGLADPRLGWLDIWSPFTQSNLNPSGLKNFTLGRKPHPYISVASRYVARHERPIWRHYRNLGGQFSGSFHCRVNSTCRIILLRTKNNSIGIEHNNLRDRGNCHFYLQPLFPRRGVVHPQFQYTRNADIRNGCIKNFRRTAGGRGMNFAAGTVFATVLWLL